jgi:hypothetical protein
MFEAGLFDEIAENARVLFSGQCHVFPSLGCLKRADSNTGDGVKKGSWAMPALSGDCFFQNCLFSPPFANPKPDGNVDLKGRQ